jgi:hypothetical protein
MYTDLVCSYTIPSARIIDSSSSFSRGSSWRLEGLAKESDIVCAYSVSSDPGPRTSPLSVRYTECVDQATSTPRNQYVIVYDVHVNHRPIDSSYSFRPVIGSRHYCFVGGFVGQPMVNLKSSKQMIQIVYDAYLGMFCDFS